VRCRVVDKLAAPSGYCKAIGVTPRTLEVWEDMGIARAIIDAGLWLRGVRTIIAGQQRDSVLDFSELPYGSLGIPQFATEVRAMKAQGLGASEIAKALKIGRASVYRVLEAQ
jgi:Helix-turn-helix domain of resolvase/FAD binding domain